MRTLVLTGSGVIAVSILGVALGFGQAANGSDVEGWPAAAADGRKAGLAQLLREQPLVRVHERGDRLTRVYGAPMAEGASPVEAAETFRLNHAAVFGVQPQDLHPLSLLEDRRHTQPVMPDRANGSYKFTLVYYSQHKNGIPVFRADLRVLVANQPANPVVWAGSNLRELGGFEPSAQAVDPAAWDRAKQVVQRLFPGLINFTPPQLTIWAGTADTAAQPADAIVFQADNGQPAPHQQKWLIVADLASGAVLYQENKVIELDVQGNISGMSTQGVGADICEPEELEAMSYARATIGATEGFADINGDYVVSNPGVDPVTVQSALRGQYFRVFNAAGADTVLSEVVTPPGPADFVHNSFNHVESERAETNAYIEANIVRDAILQANPNYPVIPGQTEYALNVNLVGGICPGNAQYVGDALNFCLSGGGQPNTAWSSVVYHEYGHHLVETGGSGQGAYGEGMGDVMSVVVLDDPRVGYGFFGNCNSSLRTADNNCQYLEAGCSTCGSGSHACGQLLSGCVWDTRDELVITEPDDYQQILMDLSVNSVLMHSGSGIAPDITVDWLTLDDDDQNIGNGTPHYPEICAGFGAHGMDCPPLDAVAFDYPRGRPQFVPPGQESIVPVTVSGVADDPVPGSGTLSYRFASTGHFTTVPMNEIAPNEYEAALPGTECAGIIQYYFSVDAVGVGTVNDPADAPAATFSTTAASDTTTVFEDTFELDQGWTVLNSGGLTDGGWERDVPVTICDRGNPQFDGDGSGRCFVTDNSAANDCNSDVDDGSTALTSPVMDASDENMMISYYRWFSNTQGSAPLQDVFQVDFSVDGGTNWLDLETVGPAGSEVDGGWFFKEFRLWDVPGFVPTTEFRIRFIASDIDPQSVVEAGVDGVRLFRLECDAACAGDLTGDGTVGSDDLALLLGAWGVNPGHPADLDGSGAVDSADLALLLGAWGPCL